MTTRLTIGQIAKLAGVNIQTLRYYERRRLLVPVTRKSSGYRLYDEAAVRRLTFIRNAQELGFTLKEVSDLLALRVNNTARCEEVKRRAQSKLAEVQKRLKRLKRLNQVLEELVQACEARRPTADCPILRSLEHKEVIP